MAVAVLLVIVFDALLPSAARVGRWWAPAIAGILLIALVISDPGRINEQRRQRLSVSLALLAVLIASELASTCLLIH